MFKNEPNLKSTDDNTGSDDYNSNLKGTKNQVVRFFSGNPAVETVEGFLHLYKEVFDSSDLLPSSHMISIICIPATFCLQDLLQFLRPISNDLELIRIVKPASPNEYMALLKFRSLDSAHEFYKTFNDTPFNSIEPDICHLVFVAKIECISSENGGGKAIPNAVELPVCAVCLEKMDESVEGILTILCNHSFHAPCMAQCEDTTCPVCRYIQTPMPVAGNKCIQCSIHEDLWICLICGEVGCGRYANGHAYGHFKETAHTYAMQLGSNRVWDYVGENYVHRLVLNKMDGKLVEVDNRGNEVIDPSTLLHQEEKIESLSLEYAYLLTSQLESQREYFEKKMMYLEDQKCKELEEAEIQCEKVKMECTEKNNIIANFNKDKMALEKKCALLNTKTTKLQAELSEEREMNKCLRENQLVWQAKVTNLESKLLEKENEIKELQDQLRDIMFYLEAKDRLKETKDISQEEIAQGQISLQTEEPHGVTGSSSGGGGRRNRKKK
ncbi:hypothetical protein HELRODRAFT_100087 [Helobdella robusta]|uniref:BRCA1-associated protein n=1 Tax=Helobdella robusta TaxID=6412 RepID=T1ECY5_HELRO|nr:hypothetical protein HELRODRAFT_100087 [Helobdella robusta]ESO03286.1 hypothetical protein HELRODRAFT_100087 [Helobdella robusta]